MKFYIKPPTFTGSDCDGLLRVQPQHGGQAGDVDVAVHVSHHPQIGLLQGVAQLETRREVGGSLQCGGHSPSQ